MLSPSNSDRTAARDQTTAHLSSKRANNVFEEENDGDRVTSFHPTARTEFHRIRSIILSMVSPRRLYRKCAKRHSTHRLSCPQHHCSSIQANVIGSIFHTKDRGPGNDRKSCTSSLPRVLRKCVSLVSSTRSPQIISPGFKKFNFQSSCLPPPSLFPVVENQIIHSSRAHSSQSWTMLRYSIKQLNLTINCSSFLSAGTALFASFRSRNLARPVPCIARLRAPSTACLVHLCVSRRASEPLARPQFSNNTSYLVT